MRPTGYAAAAVDRGDVVSLVTATGASPNDARRAPHTTPGLAPSGRRRELAARRGDVSTTGEPDGGGEARGVENGLEARDRLRRRAVVHPSRVVRNQVHL